MGCFDIVLNTSYIGVYLVAARLLFFFFLGALTFFGGGTHPAKALFTARSVTPALLSSSTTAHNPVLGGDVRGRGFRCKMRLL